MKLQILSLCSFFISIPLVQLANLSLALSSKPLASGVLRYVQIGPTVSPAYRVLTSNHAYKTVVYICSYVHRFLCVAILETCVLYLHIRKTVSMHICVNHVNWVCILLNFL